MNRIYVMKMKTNANESTYFDSVGRTLVFSDDKVFSYNRVDRRGMIPPPLLGPTVWLPLVGSYFDVVRGLAGLDAAATMSVVKIN